MKSKISWNDITLQQYLDIKNLMLDADIDDEDRTWFLVNIIYNVNSNDIPLGEFKQYVESLDFIKNAMPKMKIKEDYILNGNEYHLFKELSDFSVAQFIDWQNYMKEGGNLDNASSLLSVFLRPKDKKYGEGYNVNDVKSDILNYMKITDVNTVLAFFFKLSKAYIVRFLYCSMKAKTKGMPMKMKRKIMKETKKTIKAITLGD